jgi:hypothetical protein
MRALTNVAAATFAPAFRDIRLPARANDVVGWHVDAVRPSRIGGAPLTGARAVHAYQRTAAVDSSRVLSRIDERA